MKRLMVHNPFFRLLVPPLAGIFLYLLILLFDNALTDIQAVLDSQEVYVVIGLAFLMSESSRMLLKVLAKYEWSRANLYIHLSMGLILTGVVISIAISIYFQWMYDFSISQSQLIIFNVVFGFASLLYNLLYLSQLYLYKENSRQLIEEQTRLDTINRQLLQYKNEVNPHLLYDSLETLISLIHTSIEDSEDYIDELAGVYRYILTNKTIEFATVKQDLKVARSIVTLLNHKYQDSITFSIEVPNYVNDSHIIPGTLPTIVEQIIRSTIVSKLSPLDIQVVFDQDENYLIVQYKINDKLYTTETKSMEKLHETYTIYSDKPFVMIRAHNLEFIKIPLPEVIDEPLSSTPQTAHV